MNDLRAFELREFLADLPPEKFDMSEWNTCIAGYAISLWDPSELTYPFADAQEILGLTDEQATQLFIPSGPSHTHTLEAAIATLDHLIETDDVVWGLAQ
jgi:hypothetical protein